MKKYSTPLIDELEKGPWPSFVTEMKKAAKALEFERAAFLRDRIMELRMGL